MVWKDNEKVLTTYTSRIAQESQKRLTDTEDLTAKMVFFNRFLSLQAFYIKIIEHVGHTLQQILKIGNLIISPIRGKMLAALKHSSQK